MKLEGSHANRRNSIQGKGHSKPRGRQECAGATGKPLRLEKSEGGIIGDKATETERNVMV